MPVYIETFACPCGGSTAKIKHVVYLPDESIGPNDKVVFWCPWCGKKTLVDGLIRFYSVAAMPDPLPTGAAEGTLIRGAP